MSYNINVTNSNPITILSGTSDTSTALTLVGKNIANYGEIFAQNFVTLMQNFASPSAPNGVLEGQLWYDSGTYSLKLYKNGSYKVISTISSSTTAPTAPYIGDLWWDTANSLLKIWNTTTWVSIGPNVLNTSSSAVADAILDTNNVLRPILKMVVDSAVVAVFSSDTFAPQTSYNGLTLIYGGMTLVGTGTTFGNIVSSFASITTLNATTTNAIQINAATVVATTIGNANSAIRGTSATVAGAITAATVNALNIGNAGATITGTHNGSLNGPFNGTIGATAANTGIFTTLTATTGYTGPVAGPFNGTIGATAANTGAFTSLTASTSIAAGTVQIWSANNTVTGASLIGTLTGSATSATFVTGLTAANVQSVIGSVSSGNFPTLNQNTIGSAGTFTSTTQNSQFNSIGVGIAASGTVGEIRATNNIYAYATSDARFKENIKVLVNPLKTVENLRGVSFDWSNDYIESRGGEDGYFIRKHDIGIIAQEVEVLLPEIVATRDDGYKAVKYEKLVAVLIEAIKELSEKVSRLEEK